MIVPGSANPLLLGQSQGYNLTRSLRFRSSASAYLSKNFSTTRTSGTTMTFSTWLKRGGIGSTTYHIFGGYDGSSAAATGLAFSQDGYTDSLVFQFGGASGTVLATTPVYRDPSAWYHIVLAVDTTQATNTNRVKIYVNNVQVTTFANTFYPSQNATFQFLLGNANNSIGKFGNGGINYFDGYMAETYCIDGQALTPSSFGATNASTGVWQPAKYLGTYGTNGFYLPFTDNSALTSGSNAGLGKDFSGNGNYWNTNNISITSGVTYDSMTDVPTLTSATAANYCVLNPLAKASSIDVSAGNLQFTRSSTGDVNVLGSMGMSSGKWYWEVYSISNNSATATTQLGIANSSFTGFTSPAGNSANAWVFTSGAFKGNNNSYTSGFGSTWSTGDVMQIAFDADAGKVWFGRNGTWIASGDPASGANAAFSSLASGTYFFVGGINGSADNMAANFGQRPFAYTPPTGYVALNTYNLPTPTIGATASSQANKYMDVSLYTGTGSNGIVVTNSGLFQPDFVWVKTRSGAGGHVQVDAVRGINKHLTSNITDAEYTESGTAGLQSFNSNGFTVGTQNVGPGDVNNNGTTYVGWQWKANGSGSSNTSGSITSTVSANTTSGFSTVKWTATSGAQTVGHGLGVAPKMIIQKSTSNADDWIVYHASVGSGKYMVLNTTAAQATYAGIWSGISSTTFPSDTATNATNGRTYVAYCFAEIAGFSKFGSYTGNGSTDGPFTYTGFRPRFVLIKKSSDIQGWYMYDSARGTYNVIGPVLEAQSSAAEGSASLIDFLSNGFKIRESGNGNNTSGGTYIYAAFAENPFKYSLAR